MAKIVYHPGTGTYWGFSDEWYVIDVDDSLITDQDFEDCLDRLHISDQWKCGECRVNRQTLSSAPKKES